MLSVRAGIDIRPSEHPAEEYLVVVGRSATGAMSQTPPGHLTRVR
jgi:hypothetical protein